MSLEENEKYRCPCCGYKTVDLPPPNTFDICDVCFWEERTMSEVLLQEENRMAKEDLLHQMHNLRQGKMSSSEMYGTIHEFGREYFLEARPVVERFLTHDNAQLHSIALEVLAWHWRLPGYWDMARTFLEHDPDSECRMRAALVLGVIKRNTQDRRTLSVLAHVVCNPQEEELVRETAYAAMRDIIHYDPREQFHLASKRLNLSQDVDWGMVEAYL